MLNSSHTLMSVQYHSETSGDKLFLLSSVILFFFFFSLRLRACVYIWSDIHPTWETLGLPLYIFENFFSVTLCECSCLHLPCVYLQLLWQPTTESALTTVQRQVAYVALCLRVGKLHLSKSVKCRRGHHTLTVKYRSQLSELTTRHRPHPAFFQDKCAAQLYFVTDLLGTTN